MNMKYAYSIDTVWGILQLMSCIRVFPVILQHVAQLSLVGPRERGAIVKNPPQNFEEEGTFNIVEREENAVTNVTID